MFNRIFVAVGADRFAAGTLKQLAEGAYQMQATMPLDQESWHRADVRFERFPVEEMSAVAVAVNASAIIVSGVRADGRSAATNVLLAGVATPDMFRRLEAVLQGALFPPDAATE